MIDVSAFQVEREKLRRFCFARTRAAIVIRDVTSASTQRGLGEEDHVSRLAELLQILLTVDAERFADPDDSCSNIAPSIFAFPSPDAQRDVTTILAAAKGSEPIIVDFRLIEIVWPLLAPQLASDITRSTKVWDRAMRKQRRVCAIVTRHPAIDDIAIQCDGACLLLRRSGGETFDLAGRYWREVYGTIASQRCMRREEWQRSAFRTRGNA
jgi:hypothetical protein